jgi:glycosyltransferase involved in cell wall biosynthesis
MKILELTNFSAGICGVWQRVSQEAILLTEKGHEVVIMSSNAVKGSNDLANKKDSINGVKIIRFPFKKYGGESYMKWFKEEAEKTALEFKPDIIIAHSYRHPHTTKALKIAKKAEAKCFLVTHAPFIQKGENRSFLDKIVIKLYDKFVGSWTINKFDKVIFISHWELEELKKLGLHEDKIVYIPNWIKDEFFNKSLGKEDKNKLLFFGRIADVKDPQTLINAFSLINKNLKINLEFVGPSDFNYICNMKYLVNNLGLNSKIKFLDPISDIDKKIKKLDSANIFVLPSRREGQPQALIEAMARKRIVIASKIKGAMDLVKEGKNGYLFEIGDKEDLKEKILIALRGDNKKMREEARKTVNDFRGDKIIKRLESLF